MGTVSLTPGVRVLTLFHSTQPVLVPAHITLGLPRCVAGTLSGLRLVRGPGWMKPPCPPLTGCLLPQPHSSVVLASDGRTTPCLHGRSLPIPLWCSLPCR